MAQTSDNHRAFQEEVAERFGLLPNFFSSAPAAPELIEHLWQFAKAAYLDNPIPALFKERLFVVLSRLCPARYCIVRHVGFLLGKGHAAGDRQAPITNITKVIRLLTGPLPWSRDMSAVYGRLQGIEGALGDWPEPASEMEDLLFACAAIVFSEPARSDAARDALLHVLGERRWEYLAGLLAFIRTAHYWTLLHPEIETESDMRELLRDHVELARLLSEDPEADRCEMGARVFDELQALRELHEREELKKAKAALEEKDRKKDEFIAILAHELRNPLAAIRSATDILALMNLEDPQLVRLRAQLDRQSAVMERMLGDLLDAGLVAFGKISVDFEALDFTELVREIIAENEQKARAAGLEFKAALPASAVCVMGDPVRLQQIINNLISNAIKFTPAPGRIMICLREEDGMAVFRVEDTGIGFDSSLASQLFEPFIQRPQGVERFRGGLGLGLAISRALAKIHNGSLLGASSGEGQGAAFTWTLPLASSAAATALPSDHQHRAKGPRVLLIEDNRDVADSLGQVIKLMGCEIEVAYDGRSGLALALASRPDLVLCDLGLPGGMDGYALARKLRADPRMQATRLVAVTGYSQPPYRAAAEQAGFDQLVAKPITIDSIKALLKGPLSSPRQ